jgi:hypothetical protein
VSVLRGGADCADKKTAEQSPGTCIRARTVACVSSTTVVAARVPDALAAALDAVAEAEGVTRCEYLRRLLEADVADQVATRARTVLEATERRRSDGRAVT